MIDINTIDFAKNPDNLVPAIIQDDCSQQVLMLGYMSKEALELTLETNKVTFYSRTRQTIWTKGESSGNFLHVKSIQVDCDQDTLLIKASPDGPTCHTGSISCFDQKETETAVGFIKRLEKVVQQRHKDMPEKSYTTHLFTKGINKIAQKVGEEAVETVIDAVAGNKDGVIYEASDLVFHLLVLLEAMDLSLSDLEKELLSRHSKG